MCFFLSHSFVALVVCFGSLSCWNTHPQPIFNALAGFNALALVFSSSKHSQRAGFWAHLTTTLSPSTPLNHWHTSDRTVHVLSWAGDLVGASRISFLHGVLCSQLFSWWPMVPAALRSLTKILPCSSGLIPHRSHDHWNFTRWDLVWSPQTEGDWQLFCISSICELSHQLLSPSHQAAWRWSCSPFQPCVDLQSCPWHPLDSSLVLAVVESLESDRLISSVYRCLSYR